MILIIKGKVSRKRARLYVSLWRESKSITTFEGEKQVIYIELYSQFLFHYFDQEKYTELELNYA